DDAGLVEARQRRLTHVGDIGGDLLGAEFGVPRGTGQFLDMDGGETVFLHHTLGDDEGVLEVVAVPGHEGDAHVLAEGQFAEIDGGAIGEDIALGHHIAALDDGALVDAGVLVGPGVLDEVVDVDTGVAGLDLVVVDPHHDAAGIDVLDHSAALGHHAHTGIPGHDPLDTGAHQGLLGTQGGHRLALHVRSHQCAVGVIVLEERNQRGGNGYHLTGGHVHVIHFLGRLDGELAHVAHGHQLLGQLTLGIDAGGGLGDDVLALLDGGQVLDLVGHLAIDHLAVGRLDEAVVVGAGIGGQGVDQPDVRAFRGLDGTYPAVVGRVHVAHLEAGALAGQTAGAQGGNPALVGDLGQRVVLIHELGQLA